MWILPILQFLPLVFPKKNDAGLANPGSPSSKSNNEGSQKDPSDSDDGSSMGTEKIRQMLIAHGRKGLRSVSSNLDDNVGNIEDVPSKVKGREDGVGSHDGQGGDSAVDGHGNRSIGGVDTKDNEDPDKGSEKSETEEGSEKSGSEDEIGRAHV